MRRIAGIVHESLERGRTRLQFARHLGGCKFVEIRGVRLGMVGDLMSLTLDPPREARKLLGIVTDEKKCRRHAKLR